MSDELTNIKKKVHALLSKTIENGCSEHEAMAAAEKAGELMDFYNLKITDIEIRDTKCKHVQIEINTAISGRLDNCVTMIGRFCDCKVWFSRGRKSYSSGKPELVRGGIYHFFGLEQDAEVAEYIYQILDHAIEMELATFKKSVAYKNSHRKKTATKTFYRGFSGRINMRLGDMKKLREDELAKAEKAMERTGRSIMLIKQSHIEDEFKRDLGITLVKRKTTVCTHDHSAYNAGQAAGNRVNINPGINNKSTSLLA